MDERRIREYLDSQGAIYGKHYTLGGLGDNIFGIEKMGRFWYSYEAQWNRRKTNYKRFSSEEEAYSFIIDKAKAAVREADSASNSDQ